MVYVFVEILLYSTLHLLQLCLSDMETIVHVNDN